MTIKTRMPTEDDLRALSASHVVSFVAKHRGRLETYYGRIASTIHAKGKDAEYELCLQCPEKDTMERLRVYLSLKDGQVFYSCITAFGDRVWMRQLNDPEDHNPYHPVIQQLENQDDLNQLNIDKERILQIISNKNDISLSHDIAVLLLADSICLWRGNVICWSDSINFKTDSSSLMRVLFNQNEKYI